MAKTKKIQKKGPKPAKAQSDKKTIAINCSGAGKLGIDLLTPLQGNLKTLHEENYGKLRNVLIEEGVIEPVSIWEDPKSGKMFILNGHQRIHTLRRMRDEEGFVIPQIPVNMVEARDIKHAKKMVLPMTSQYGTINPEAAFEYLETIEVDADHIKKFLNFADFDMDRFVGEYFPEPKDEEEKVRVSSHDRKKNSGEIDKDSVQKFEHKCPRCSFEFD